MAAQFEGRGQPVEWLAPGQVLTSRFAVAEAPRLVIDCLGADGNPLNPWLAEDLFTQLLTNCNEREWVWLLLSDSRVFPAAGKHRFVETDAPIPGVPAGERLLARERCIAGAVSRHIVLRTGPLIAGVGDNLLTRLVRQLLAGGSIVMPDLQRFCPTPVADIARVIAAIHAQLDCGAACWGIYHYESADPAPGDEFAEVVLAAAAQYWPLADDAVPSRGAVGGVADVFPLLNCQRIRDTFGIQQLPWRKAIPTMLKQMYAGEPI